MLKRFRSVSMVLFLMGISAGTAYAVASPDVAAVKSHNRVVRARVLSKMKPVKV